MFKYFKGRCDRKSKALMYSGVSTYIQLQGMQSSCTFLLLNALVHFEPTYTMNIYPDIY